MTDSQMWLLILLITAAALTLLIWSYERKVKELEDLVEDIAEDADIDINLFVGRPRSLRGRIPEPAEEKKPELQVIQGSKTCGARSGDLVCTLLPHDTPWHQDQTKGTAHHSATFKADGPVPGDVPFDELLVDYQEQVAYHATPGYSQAELDRWP